MDRRCCAMQRRTSAVLSFFLLLSILAHGTVVASSLSSGSSSAPSPPSSTVTVPIPTASADSTTFQLVSDVVCNDTVVDIVYKTYTTNRAIFDQCVADSDYQIFPYSGTVPTAESTQSMVDSQSCIAIFIAIVQMDAPACSISDMPLRAVCELLLNLATEIKAHGEDAPTPEKFQELLTWRRNVDLSQAAGVPYDQNSILFELFEENLQAALDKYSSTIHVLSDLTIQIGGTTAPGTKDITFATISDSSLANVATPVQTTSSTSSDASETSVADKGSTTSASASSTEAETQTSAASTSLQSSASRLLLCLVISNIIMFNALQ